MPILKIMDEEQTTVFFEDVFIAGDLYTDNIIIYVKEALERAAVFERGADERK